MMEQVGSVLADGNVHGGATREGALERALRSRAAPRGGGSVHANISTEMERNALFSHDSVQGHQRRRRSAAGDTDTDSAGASETVSAADFYAEYHGHPLAVLNTVFKQVST